MTSPQNLAVIINHFDKYPLITQKRADYELFKQAFDLVKSKKLLTIEGLHKIVAIKASINRGLPDELKAAICLGPYIVPVERPLVEDQKIQDPNWLAGFVDGEGCFYIMINKSKTYKLGYQVGLGFQCGQHTKDAQLIKSFVDFLQAGRLVFKKDQPLVVYTVTKFSDIE